MTQLLQHTFDALSLGSIYALVALGIALIFGIMRLINFAHGELIMIGGYSMLLLQNTPWYVLVAGTILLTALAGVLMERIAFRPVRGASPATLMITSFAVSFLLQNLAILTLTAQTRAVQISITLDKPVNILGARVSELDILTAGCALALMIGLALFLKKTPIGRQMRAAAEDFRMARLLGVRANFVIPLAFAVSGLLAGAAAIFVVVQSGTVWPTIGLTPFLAGVVATVIGGVGSLPGAVLGGYVLGVLTVVLQVTLPSNFAPYRDAFAFGIVILILLARPGGLFSRQQAAAVRV